MMENWRYTPRYPVHQHWQGLNGDIANNLLFGDVWKCRTVTTPNLLMVVFLSGTITTDQSGFRRCIMYFQTNPSRDITTKEIKEKTRKKTYTYISYTRYPLVVSIKWFPPLLRKLCKCLHQNFLWETCQLSSVLSWVLPASLVVPHQFHHPILWMSVHQLRCSSSIQL